MNYEDINVDDLIEDIYACLEEPPAPPPRRRTEPPASPVAKQRKKKKLSPKKRSAFRTFLSVMGKLLLVLLETVLLAAVALYGVMYVLAKGPSPTARDLFVRTVQETSAMGFLANLYFTDAEIAEIMGGNEIPEYVEMDTSLIEIPKPSENAPNTDDGPVPDAWGFVDEDGDGIIVDEVKGEGYSGYMMIVLDPSRVILGSIPASYESRGYTVAQMVEQFDAVAGINAGGFFDEGGGGNGSIPDTMVVYDGQIYYGGKGPRFGFAGFDSNHILHVGNFYPSDIRSRDIQYGVGFGPVLVLNGEVAYTGYLGSGVNPRTGIGQRSDGAVLMLVIEGRQVTSLGCTFMDMADIFLDYGAVNACNMDGGSSSMMWYQGDYINDCASVIGIRPVPTAFLVLKEGVDAYG